MEIHSTSSNTHIDKLEEDDSFTDSDLEGVSDDDPEQEGVSVFITETEIEEIHRGKFDWDKFISDLKDYIDSAYALIGVKRARHE